MIITRSVVYDLMSQILNDLTCQRQKLYQSLGLPMNKPVLLAALPPNFMYIEGSRPSRDFKKYDDLVKFWIKSLAQIKIYNLVICLHLIEKYEQMKYIEDRRVNITIESTAELILFCDIYIASVSATIQ